MNTASTRSRLTSAAQARSAGTNNRRPRSPMPARRVQSDDQARHRTTRRLDGTSAARSTSSGPSYPSGSAVTTMGSHPYSGRCGASSRTRWVAALESGGKCGDSIRTRRIRISPTRPRHQMAVGQIAVDRSEASVGSDALARVPRRVELAETGPPRLVVVNLDNEDRASGGEQARRAVEDEGLGAFHIDLQERRGDPAGLH